MTKKSILKTLEEKLDPTLYTDLKQSINTAFTGEMRKTVYTSMDGDDTKYVDFIRVFVYEHGYIPVNPIATLGYYTSTIGHHGVKKEIIKDCYSLMLSCEELWIFSKKKPQLDLPGEKGDTLDPNELSEGILAELLVWLENKPNSPIRLFTWKDVGIPKYANQSQWALTGKEAKEAKN